jgi:hypothetical protein
MFEDVVNRFDDPKWLWVRGVVNGDFDANAAADQEAVIATIQGGSRRAPGPIESAYLLICRVGPGGKRSPTSRIKLFDSHPAPTAPRPAHDATPLVVEPLIHARAQVLPDKLKLGDSVMVYFWGGSYPTTVWYACFASEDDALTKTFEGCFWQTNRGVAALNLDKRGGRDSFGYQFVRPVAPFPEELAHKIGGWRRAPTWGHVYTPLREGGYAQADALYGDHYDRIENEWNEKYLEVLYGDLTQSELAWYEYHLGLLAHYTGKQALVKRYLDKAARNAADDILSEAIANAYGILDQPIGKVGVPSPVPENAEKP